MKVMATKPSVYLRRLIPMWFLMVLFPINFISAAAAQKLTPESGDSEPRVIINGSRHPSANSSLDAGAVDGNTAMERMVLVLGPSPEQEYQLRTLLDSQQSKGSKNYHRWLSPEEFGGQFGPAPEDLERTKQWLALQGFSIGRIARSGRWMEFSGSVSQVEAAFQTKMRHYQVEGVIHTANATDVSVPSGLSPLVRGVLSLNDFKSKALLTKHYAVQRNSSGALVPSDPDFTSLNASGAFHYLTPADFAAIYGLAPLYKAGIDGSGRTIAVVARSNIDFADVEVFRQAFSLPPNDPNVIISGSDPGYDNDSVEAALDVEWAGAIAPKATIDMVITASTTNTDGVALSAAYIVDNNLADVMSVSYGLCENDLGSAGTAFYNALWQQAAAQGISVVVAAGDNGAAGCDDPNDPSDVAAQGGLGVSGMASTPFNTAVGGTQFAENGNDSSFWNNVNAAGFSSAIGYIPENVWNESCDPTKSTTCPNGDYSLYAGSGGVSSVFSKPSWQSGTGVPADAQRDLPDVSLTAAADHDGYLMCSVGSCLTTADGNLLLQATVVGGTSASSPSFAGILALVDQKLGSRQGLANYALYPLAAQQSALNCDSSAEINPTTSSQCIFNDVTAGNNGVPGLSGYSASGGFDLATGLGSVNAANLVTGWASAIFQGSVTSLTAPTTPLQHGQIVPVSVTVGASSGNGTPSGNFVLMSDKYGPVAAGNLTGGSFNGSVASLPGGQYNLTAHYPGDGSFGSSDSPSVAVNVAQENSTISLNGYTYSGGPIVVSTIPYGNFVYLHVQVSSASGVGIPTGSITYLDGGNPIGTVALNSAGQAELVSGGYTSLGAVICLSVGTHNITANYSGDNSLHSSLTSQPLVITVTKATPTVYFFNTTEMDVPSTQQVALIGFVANNGPALPTGTLQFVDGTTPLGSPVPIAPSSSTSRPQASLQVSLTPGVHTITLNYSGDSTYNAAPLSSGFPPLIVNVTSGSGTPTQTTFTAAPTSATVGQVVNYAVTVTSSAKSPVPTGTIQLYQPGYGPLLAPVTLQNGSVNIPMQWAFAGNLSLVAQYSGDSSNALSATAPLSVAIGSASTAVSLTSSAQVVKSGSQVSLTALVTTPIRVIVGGGLVGVSGWVQFLDSLNGSAAQPIGSPAVLIGVNTDPAVNTYFAYSGIAAMPIVLSNGTHLITAQYLGSGSYSAATSAPITVIVGTRAASQTSLTVDTNLPTFGQVLNFSARITSVPSSPAPTGTVQFVSPTAGVVGTSTLQNGSAVLAIPWTAGGIQNVIAQYSGDNSYASSESAPVSITLPAFQFSLGADRLGIPAGTDAAVSVHLTPIAGFHSTVSLSCGNPISAGSTCSIDPSSLTLDGVSSVTAYLVLSTTAPSGNITAGLPAQRHSLLGLSLFSGLVAFVLIGSPHRRKAYSLMFFLAAAFLVAGLACGGGGGSSGGISTAGGGDNSGGGGSGTGAPVSTTTTLTASAIRVPGGSPLTLTASVASSVSVTGSVIFFDGGTQIGQVAVSDNQAQLVISTLSVGTHSITAVYGGDTKNLQSTSSFVSPLVTGTVQFPVTATSGRQSQTIMMDLMIE